MEKNYLKIFDVEDSEQNSVLLLLCQSVFLGIFAGSFEIAASSLFLDAFTYDMLPKAILLSGIVGIIITSIYSKLQSTLNFSRLALLNLLFIVFITFTLRIGYSIINPKILAFLTFVLFGPLNIVSIVAFWGMATRMFSLRQGKRLFGLIDTGQVLGIVLSTFTIPLLLSFGLPIENLLYISFVSITGALLVQFIITKHYSLDTVTKIKEKKQTISGIKFLDLFKNKYTLYIVLFVSLSMVTAFFIFNSFLSVAKEKYPDSKDFASFLSLFTGTTMIFSILIKTFVYSNLLKTYGLRTGLLLSPILIVGLTLVASFIGSFGYTVEAKVFIFFFLMITLSRLLSVSLKVSIESPSSKLLYQSLDENVRHDVQAKIDGVVNESAALLSGVLLAIFGALAFIKLIHLTYILLFISVAWMIIGYRLHAAYRRSLEDNLDKTKKMGDDNSSSQTEDITSILLSRINNTNENDAKRLDALNILQAYSRNEFEKCFPQIIEVGSPAMKSMALKFIDEQKLIACLPQLSDKNGDILIDYKKSISFSKEEIQLLDRKETFINYSKAREKDKRIFAARYFGYRTKNNLTLSQISSLLRDADNDVKAAAIMSSMHHQLPELVSVYAELLDHPIVGYMAFEAITFQGKSIIDVLELAYYKTGLSTQTQFQIIRLLGAIGDEKGIQFLADKLNLTNLELLNETVLSLMKCRYRFQEEHRIGFNNAIHIVLSSIAWTYSVKLSIQKKDLTEQFILSIDAELERSYDLLYNILSLLYDVNSVKHVRQNIEKGTGESLGYALELMDIFMDDELKPILIPFFEDSTLEVKVKNLQNNFPIDQMSLADTLLSVINKDYNTIGIWTKACAINAFAKSEKIISNDLIALLFHPDKLIYESAAIIINQIDPEALHQVVPRLGIAKQAIIRESLNFTKKSVLSYEIIKNISETNIFKSIRGEDLVVLLNSIKVISTDTEAFVSEQTDVYQGYFLCVEGVFEYCDEQNNWAILSPSNMWCLMSIKHYRLTEETVAYYLPLGAYNNFVSSFPSIIKLNSDFQTDKISV